MNLKECLTESEKRTKQWWLALLLIAVLMNAIVFFGLIGSDGRVPSPGFKIPVAFRFVGFGSGLAFAYLYYALCYRRPTTFLLTLSLIGFWITLLGNGVLFFQGLLRTDLILGISLLTGTMSYIFNRRLRCLNMALKGYAKFPEESKEASSLLQSAGSKEELQNTFADGLKKWPRLKWVLLREKKIKEEILNLSQ